ncbi:MAG: hypothetical protein K8I60_14485, partial [Anaerolineae bacterium]|nr:hypothetical protein [Anaerolineae bacterium]
MAPSPGSDLEDVVAVIRAQHNSLSSSQQKVTGFLLEHGLDVIHYTVSQIAEAVEVNPSTVVRTAQTLGYKGFPEMQSALRDQLMRQARLSERLQIGSKQIISNLQKGQTDSGETSIFQAALREEIDNLLNLPQHVPIAD